MFPYKALFKNISNKAIRDLQRLVRNRKWDNEQDGVRVGGSIVMPYGKISVMRRAVGRSSMKEHGRFWLPDQAGEIVTEGINLMTNQGMDYFLAAGLRGQTPYSAWHLLPYTNDISPAASWTMANFDSNAGEITDYDESERADWLVTGESNGVVTAAVDSTITCGSGGVTLRGIGVGDSATKGATTNVLLCAAKLNAAQVYVDDDTLTINYELSLTN